MSISYIGPARTLRHGPRNIAGEYVGPVKVSVEEGPLCAPKTGPECARLQDNLCQKLEIVC